MKRIAINVALSLFLWVSLCSWALERKEQSSESFHLLYSRSGTLDESIERFEAMEQIRRSALSSLERLRKSRPSVELDLRFGELLLERARDLTQFSMELELAGKNIRAKELKTEAQGLLKKGFSLHEKTLKLAKTHPLAPQLYLGISRLHQMLKQPTPALNEAEAGLHILKSREKTEPNLEAKLNIALAEAAFSLKQLEKAAMGYERAVKIWENQITEDRFYAQYKLSWVRFNQRNAELAVSILAPLIEKSTARVALKEEALKDYVLFVSDLSSAQYTEMGEEKGIFNYLVQYSNLESSKRNMLSLAQSFYSNGKRKQAVAVYEYLLNERPIDADNAELALKLLDIQKTLSKKVELAKLYVWLVDSYGPQSGWLKTQTARPDVQQVAILKIGDALKDYSLDLHKELNKETSTQRRAELRGAVGKLYDLYLSKYPDEALLHYYRAEIYTEDKNYLLAAESFDKFSSAYAKLTQSAKTQVNEKIFEQALLGRVQTWAKVLEEKDLKIKDAPLSFLKAVDEFVEKLPKHPKAAEALLDSAKVESKGTGSEIQSAINRLEKLVILYPKTKESVDAANATLDLLLKLDDYIAISDRANKFLSTLEVWAPKDQQAKIKSELLAILSKTEAKACEAMSKNPTKIMEAAICYESFARNFSSDPLAPKALSIAGDLYAKEKKSYERSEVLKRLVEVYPKDPQVDSAFATLAETYEKTFQFKAAAQIYEAMLESKKNLPNRSAITLRLLSLLEGMNEQKRLKAWLATSDLSPVQKELFVGRALSAELRQLDEHFVEPFDSSKMAEAEKSMAAIDDKKLNLAQQLELERLRGLLAFFKGRYEQADKIWHSALKIYWKNPSGESLRRVGARLRLAQAKISERTFQSINVEKNSTKKVELYQRLEGIYTEVVKMKVPSVALEALLRSAALSQSLATSLEVASQKAKGEERIAFTSAAAELKQKAEKFNVQVQAKALEWKALSPQVLSALNFSKSGLDEFFVWPNLGRWADLEQSARELEEWKMLDGALYRILESSKGRSLKRNAAMVLIFRKGSLKEKSLAYWSTLLTDQVGAQLLVQAYLNDGEYTKFKLYLDQYRELFGEDDFSLHMQATNLWKERDFEGALEIWTNQVAASKTPSFYGSYQRLGWNAAFAELADPTYQLDTNSFKSLASLAKTPNDQLALLYLCLRYQENCPSKLKDLSLLNQRRDPILNFKGSSNGFELWFASNRIYVETELLKIKRWAEEPQLRAAINEMRLLKVLVPDHKKEKQVELEIQGVESRLDKKMAEIRGQDRKLAEVNQ